MLHGIYMDDTGCGVKLSPKQGCGGIEGGGAYGVETSRWACAAMRWFCSYKTSRQLVSWCTGGVEGDDCHRCSDSVCLYVGGWWWYWTEYKQKSEQVLEYKEREGGRERVKQKEKQREYVCFTESERSQWGGFFCVKQTRETGVSL